MNSLETDTFDELVQRLLAGVAQLHNSIDADNLILADEISSLARKLAAGDDVSLLGYLLLRRLGRRERSVDNQKTASVPVDISKCLTVADIAMRFGRVERATMHPDGVFESDATHVTMLGLTAIEQPPPGLDQAKVLQFILVHDLPEVFAMDTNTAWGLTADQRLVKEARERAAVERLRGLGLTRIVALIEEYERQDTPEARWVRYVDKAMPKLTHILNFGRALEEIGMKRSDMLAKHEQQGLELAERYPEQTHARELFEAATAMCEDVLLRDNVDTMNATRPLSGMLKDVAMSAFMLCGLRKSVNEPEPEPLQSTGPAVWDLVIEDLAGTGILSDATLRLTSAAVRDQLIKDGRERDRIGAEKYGTRLRVGNGRDSLVDACQESLDLAVYVRQAVQEAPNASAFSKAMAIYRRAVLVAADLRFMLTASGWRSLSPLPSDMRESATPPADVYDRAAAWMIDMFDTGLIAEAIAGVDGLAWCESCGKWVGVQIEQTQGDDIESCEICRGFATEHGSIDASAVAAGLRMRYPESASRDEQLGSALRRIAKRLTAGNEGEDEDERFEWYVSSMIRDAEYLAARSEPIVFTRSKVQVEPFGPPHVDGLVERLLEMVTGAPAGVISPSEALKRERDVLAEEKAELEQQLAATRAEVEILRKVAGRTLETTPQPLPVGWSVGTLHGAERGLIGPSGSIMLDDDGNIVVAGRVPLHVSEAFARQWRRQHGWPKSAHEWNPVEHDVIEGRFQCARCLDEVNAYDGGDDTVGPAPGVSAAGLCSGCWNELDSDDPRVRLASAVEQIKAHEQAASRLVCPISQLGNAHLAWSPGTGDSPAEGWHYLFGCRGYSYTLAELDGDGDMMRWRFDEDEARWCEAEATGKHVVDEDVLIDADENLLEIERLTADRDDARRSFVRTSLSKWVGPGRPTLREHAEFYFPGQGSVLFP